MMGERSCPRLVLASSSPRRRELLGRLGLAFDVAVPEVDESVLPGEDPPAHVGRLAEEKARSVAADLPEGLVVGADTVVVLEGEIIGKPRGAEEARRMLARLAGRTHFVYTGVAVAEAASDTVRRVVVRSSVTMAPLDAETIGSYVDTGEPLDKAGAYAVQGRGGRLVSEVRGSYTNVVGLPLRALHRLLELSGCRTILPHTRL